ncbi:MAG: BON domain-containing protein [Rhodospirillaceae bacterium]|nr:BON domain-containing protein [Rhodospirillaceae bacterium]
MGLALAVCRHWHRPHFACVVAAALAVAGPLTLAGCTLPGIAIGVAASAATKATEERGFTTSVSDDALYLDINRRLLDQDGDLFSAVKLQVHEGRVLLSGEVETPESRMEAVKIAWQPDGVAEVINEMTVTGADPNGWRDFWIIKKIDGKLLLDGEIRSINYSVESVDGVVYLIGIAQNEDELNRVIDHARDVQYVRRIVSYVRIKTQAASAE